MMTFLVVCVLFRWFTWSIHFQSSVVSAAMAGQRVAPRCRLFRFPARRLGMSLVAFEMTP